MRVAAALDKFRGTATAVEATAAVRRAATTVGFEVVDVPMSDGGEGLLAALGGANRESIVTGPLGSPVRAPWRLADHTAVIEAASASGLLLAGGPAGNDPLGATTRGTGELIAHAADHGARTIVVGLGGSATTDGGLGALSALGDPARLAGIDVRVACDVRTRFVDAAAVFGPQKGATPEQVIQLATRLEELADRYMDVYGVAVRAVDGSGAAGGLGGGLMAIGGRLVSGFDLVAEHACLDDRLEWCDVVVTGEGYLDRQSLEGKVVGSVTRRAIEARRRVVAVVGAADATAAASLTALGTDVAPVTVVSLVESFGMQRAFTETRWCIEQAALEALDLLRRRAGPTARR